MEAAAHDTPSTTEAPKDRYETLDLSDIVLKPELQSRVTMNDAKVREYMTAYRNGARFPPVLVAEWPDDRPLRVTHDGKMYPVLDGWHRVQALQHIGAQTVEAQIIPSDSNTNLHQLRWIGGRRNLVNGEPLKPKDKRELFKSYVKAGNHRRGKGYKSYRDIAADLSFASHQTISNWMEKEFSSVFRAMGRNTDDEFQSKDNGGKRDISMPDLSHRPVNLFFHDMKELLKDAENDERWELIQLIKENVALLEQEHACSEPAF